MSAQRKTAARRRLSTAAILLAAGAIAGLAATGAAHAEAPLSPQEAYGNCIRDQVLQAGNHPNMDVIQGTCCAQVGGTPSFSPNGHFYACALPPADSAGTGSGHQPNPPKPGSVAILHQLPNATRV